MTLRKLFECFQLSAVALAVSGALCPALHAQALLASAPLPDAPMPAPMVEAVSRGVVTPSHAPAEHKFWDHQNRVLFIAAAALNGADFAVTRTNLQSGGHELNPVVRVFGRSTPGLAVNFVGETAGVITLSYFFHKTGHHKLERAVSLVNIAGSAGAVSFDLMHR
jgi:hypothetical protein